MTIKRLILIWSSVGLLFSLVLILYILGAAHYITDYEANTCDMTYMFEYPQYVRITLDDVIEDKYPRYALYAYGEGFVTEKLRRMYFSGIPVLFIPGNSGSHEQVRSLASVSLRKSLKDRTPFHFDFFTVSLGKDYSALYGGVLMEETEYVSYCIERILKLYKGKMDNVVLIGHSMGGIVAKGALLFKPNVNASLASIIITLATPHKPNLVFDNTFANYYYHLERESYKIKEARTSIVSIGGGPRDTLVISSQTFDPRADINVLSTSIPDVWKSTDHLSILWCKQFVFAIVRSLFDCVDLSQKPHKINSRPHERIQALDYHLKNRVFGKKLYNHPEKMKFEGASDWNEITSTGNSSSIKIIKNRKILTSYFTIKLDNSLWDYITIDTINLETRDWLFACSASKYCEWGWNLTNLTKMMPTNMHQLRKTVDLDLREIKYPDITHIVIRVPSKDVDEDVTVNIDLYSHKTRTLSLKSANSIFPVRTSRAINIDNGHVRYNVIPVDELKIFNLKLKSMKCLDEKNSAHVMVESIEPWNLGATQIQFFTKIDDGPKTFRLQTEKNEKNESQILRFTLDPTCSYTFDIDSGNLIDEISCMVRDRWSTMNIIIMSLILLLVSMRIDSEKEKLPVLLTTLVLSIYFGNLLETCVAISIIFIFATSTCVSVIFSGSIAHGIAVRFLARAIAFSMTWADWLLGGLHQLPLITTVIVMSTIPATCGALAMFISVFIYFLKLTRMYEDYLEELFWASLQYFSIMKSLKTRKQKDDQEEEEEEKTKDKILNHLIIFMLLCFVSLFAIPSVLVWAKNFSYRSRLTTEDPILLASWMVLIVCSMLNGMKIRWNYSRNRAQILSNVIQFVSWTLLSFSATNRYQFYHSYIPPIVAAITTMITLNNVIPLLIHRFFNYPI